MNRIAKFEKVSLQQFLSDGGTEQEYQNIVLPQRATAGSAGYDFITPKEILLAPGESTVIPSGIRAKIDPDWVLFILPKSGLGSKFRLQLNNTCGVIDSDYYSAANEGHILISLTNDSKSGKVLNLPAGKAIVQGIFLPYGITEDDDAEGVRTGGFGSTGV